jgi:Putative peptidoglycan binding domain
MQEHERWSVHLEYLKLAIALSTALLAAAAAIYVDSSKIPVDDSRYLLLLGVAGFFLVLIFSVVSMGYLGNHLIYFGTPAAVTVPPNRRSRRAVIAMNVSFVCLLAAALLLGLFFGLRTLHPGPSPFAQAISSGASALDPFLDEGGHEKAVLRSIERQGDGYRLVFAVVPGRASMVVTTDAAGAVTSAVPAAGPGAPGNAAELKDLQDKLSAQRQAIDELQTRLGRLGGLAAQVADLTARLQRIEQPQSEEAMTRAQISQVQQSLDARGFDSGKPDGIIGPLTRGGIRAFQAASSAPATGVLTAAQIRQLLPPAAPPP